MNINDVLVFLSAHQPMPNDPPESLLNQYRQATVILFDNPDSRCIPLLLGSFADWDDWSIYDSVQSVLRLFPVDKVVPHLCVGLQSKHRAVRAWCADSARHFPHPLLVDPLARLLDDPSAETRLPAVSALEMIQIPEVAAIAATALETETDEDVLEVLNQIVKDRKNS